MTQVGTSFNEYPATSAAAAIYFSGQPANTNTLTLGTAIFEYATDDVAAGTNIPILAAAVDSTDKAITACALAINSATHASVAGLITAVADLANDVLWLYADIPGTAGNAYIIAETLANAVSGAAANPGVFAGGQARGVEGTYVFRHTITAAEATGGLLQFQTQLAAVFEVGLSMEDAGLIVTAPDSTIAVSGGLVTITEGTTPAWTAADIIIVTIKGIEKAR
jgi:hypothetical protein